MLSDVDVLTYFGEGASTAEILRTTGRGEEFERL